MILQYKCIGNDFKAAIEKTAVARPFPYHLSNEQNMLGRFKEVHIYPTPLHKHDTKSVFKRSLTRLNLEFSFS